MRIEPVHPGNMAAGQSLAFFRANGIKGRLVYTRHKTRELRGYVCKTVFCDGRVRDHEHRILAFRHEHNI